MPGILPVAQLLSSMLENGGIVRSHDHWREVQLTRSSSTYSRKLATKGGREAGEWLEESYEEWKLASEAVVGVAEGTLLLAERGVDYVRCGESALGETHRTFSDIRLSNAVHFVVPNLIFRDVRIEGDEAFDTFRPFGKYRLSAILLSVGSRGMGLPISQVELVFSGGFSVGVAAFDSYGRRKSALVNFNPSYFAAVAAGIPCRFEDVSAVASKTNFDVLAFKDMKDTDAELLRSLPLLGDYLKTLAAATLP